MFYDAPAADAGAPLLAPHADASARIPGGSSENDADIRHISVSVCAKIAPAALRRHYSLSAARLLTAPLPLRHASVRAGYYFSPFSCAMRVR